MRQNFASEIYKSSSYNFYTIDDDWTNYLCKFSFGLFFEQICKSEEIIFVNFRIVYINQFFKLKWYKFILFWLKDTIIEANWHSSVTTRKINFYLVNEAPLPWFFSIDSTAKTILFCRSFCLKHCATIFYCFKNLQQQFWRAFI